MRSCGAALKHASAQHTLLEENVRKYSNFSRWLSRADKGIYIENMICQAQVSEGRHDMRGLYKVAKNMSGYCPARPDIVEMTNGQMTVGQSEFNEVA